ncbi:MAG TPA: EamA family transporter, partial [Pasteurellaceae bacterium]|nr:EamA family transporter [Pasteurellaceae bacterium]
QVLSPLSSFVMLLVGVFVFKEKMGLHQKIGLIILLIGLLLFFNNRLSDLLQLNMYFKGVIIAFMASTIWVAYGIAQKMLLLKFSAQQILLIIYIGCSFIFLPFSTPSQIFALDGLQLGCLIFCCANTVIAYGSYAEAINCWEVSKVSAMMTQISVFTIIFSEILTYMAPDIFVDQSLNLLSYVGALLVTSGALLSAVGHKIVLRKK